MTSNQSLKNVFGLVKDFGYDYDYNEEKGKHTIKLDEDVLLVLNEYLDGEEHMVFIKILSQDVKFHYDEFWTHIVCCRIYLEDVKMLGDDKISFTAFNNDMEELMPTITNLVDLTGKGVERKYTAEYSDAHLIPLDLRKYNLPKQVSEMFKTNPNIIF